MTLGGIPAPPAHDTAPDGDADAEARKQRLRRRLERLIGVAATEGNELVPLRNGDEIFPAMLGAIRSARHTIDMMTFVYWRGQIAHDFAAALADRARAGVRVRLLLDGFGAKKIERRLLDLMSTAGVEVAWFRKPAWLSPFKQNHRCHRKALIVDEHTAFTGGVGIAEEWCGDARNPSEWRDTHVRVRGPAVDGIAAAFAQNWAECHDETLRRPGPLHGTPAGRLVGGAGRSRLREHRLAGHADPHPGHARAPPRKSFRLATAYFAPDTYFIDLLCETARRGVCVEILLPGPHTDQRACQLAGQHHYTRLLRGRCAHPSVPADA